MSEKPHLALHVTKKGDWWVSLHHPLDKGYTIKSTSNYMDPLSAVLASRWFLRRWRTDWMPQYVDLKAAHFGRGTV